MLIGPCVEDSNVFFARRLRGCLAYYIHRRWVKPLRIFPNKGTRSFWPQMHADGRGSKKENAKQSAILRWCPCVDRRGRSARKG
jgi:hypothetical protein